MEAEFVNVYISKLRSLIDDLTHKNVMLETRLALLEKSFSEQSIKLQELEQKNNKKTKKAEENIDSAF